MIKKAGMAVCCWFEPDFGVEGPGQSKCRNQAKDLTKRKKIGLNR
jgi:hypothetical protein